MAKQKEWPHRRIIAQARQKCVKCGMSLSPTDQGGTHGTLGRPWCNGKPMGRITKRLYVEQRSGDCRWTKPTPDQRKRYAHLLKQIDKHEPYAEQLEPWTVAELWDYWRGRVTISKTLLLKLLAGRPDVCAEAAADLLKHYETDESQIAQLGRILFDGGVK